MGAAAPAAAVGFGLLEMDAINQETKAQVNALNNEMNLQIKNAATIRAAGKFNAAKQELEGEHIIGSMKADVGASGVEGDSGSVFAVLKQSYRNAELDKLSLLYESEMSAVNAENRASTLKSQAIATNKVGETRKITSAVGTGIRLSRI